MNNRHPFFNRFLLLSACALLLAACRKEKLNPSPAPKAKIITGQQVAAKNIFNYYGRNERYNDVDTLVADTVFHLIAYPPTGNYYLNGINIVFKAQFDTSYDCQYQWKIGDDPLIRTAKQFELSFGQPYGTISVRLITKYNSKRGVQVSGIDTTFQTIYIRNAPPLFGEYEGYNTDNPNRKFRIKIGWDFEPDISVNRSSFFLSNLPEGYPMKTELDVLRGRYFGVISPTVYGGQYVFYQNEWVNNVYTLGFMSKSNDSIQIRYNYGVIANYPNWPYNANDWSRVIAKVFVGKKL
jgi:hypothetical protein